jgi:hypothetical protein
MKYSVDPNMKHASSSPNYLLLSIQLQSLLQENYYYSLLCNLQDNHALLCNLTLGFAYMWSNQCFLLTLLYVEAKEYSTMLIFLICLETKI